MFAGFDFPIGVPEHYATRAGISRFREFLPRWGIWSAKHLCRFRQSRPVERPRTAYYASTDPELRDWLRWAANSGEAPSFLHAIAVAAFLADSPNYALLCPVLRELKRRNPLVPCHPAKWLCH